MSKYDRLGAYLREQGANEIAMTFAQIERVTGIKLPRSQEHQAWWSNSTSNNVMTKVWLDAGYRTEQVDTAAKKLVFRRVADAKHPGGMQDDGRVFKSPAYETEKKSGRHRLIGALKGTFTIEPGYDLTRPLYSDDEWTEIEKEMAEDWDEIEQGMSGKTNG